MIGLNKTGIRGLGCGGTVALLAWRQQQPEVDMAISKETLLKMLNEIGGVEMSETELEAALPTVQSYAELVDKLRKLDLSGVLAARLVRHDGGRGNDAK